MGAPGKAAAEAKPAEKLENPFYSLGFNILLPVLILNRGHEIFPSKGHLYALILAVAFPALYGVRGYFLSGKAPALSLMGAFGALLTGGLALLQLEGIYFAIKEGAVPLAIGLFVLGSALIKKPAALLLFRSGAFNERLIREKLRQRGAEKSFEALMVRATAWFSLSFLLSAAMNFFFGLWIFKDISPSLPEAEKREILNRQIADMTWIGYVFIALPVTLIAALILWHGLNRLKRLTGLRLDQMLAGAGGLSASHEPGGRRPEEEA